MVYSTLVMMFNSYDLDEAWSDVDLQDHYTGLNLPIKK